VPIEQIEPGDTVLTHLPDGSGVPPSVYRPHARSTTTEPTWSPPSKRRSARWPSASSRDHPNHRS